MTLSKSILSEVDEFADKYEINTPLRKAHFLAQCAHESGGFERVEENLKYSAERLLQIFPRYFDEDSAILYEYNPVAIGSKIYADRMGNGDEASKEGYKYRGRGYIQLTGKANYCAFDTSIDDDILNNPDLIATKYQLLSAAWFWNTRSLNQLADEGSNYDVVAKITKKINGGMNGLEDRVKLFNAIYRSPL